MNNNELLDILAFGAHPDDVELAASGTILKHINMGKRVGIIDLTRGEMGTSHMMKKRFVFQEKINMPIFPHCEKVVLATMTSTE